MCQIIWVSWQGPHPNWCFLWPLYILFFAVLPVKITVRKSSVTLTLKIQSKSGGRLRSQSCKVNAKKHEIFQWNVLFYNTFNGFRCDDRDHRTFPKHQALLFKFSRPSRFLLLHLRVWQLFTFGHWAKGLNLLTHAKSHFGRAVCIYFASKYWHWRCSCWTGLHMKEGNMHHHIFSPFHCCQGSSPALNVRWHRTDVQLLSARILSGWDELV